MSDGVPPRTFYPWDAVAHDPAAADPETAQVTQTQQGAGGAGGAPQQPSGGGIAATAALGRVDDVGQPVQQATGEQATGELATCESFRNSSGICRNQILFSSVQIS